MANLAGYQKLSSIFPGQPFGIGSAGPATISSDPNTRATATVNMGSNQPTLGSGILSNGDVFMMHQTQGTNAGQWELNKVVSGGGTTSPTCQNNFNNTYTTGAQVIKFSLNSTVTISSFTPTAWNGSTGGITIICAQKTISGSGTISAGGIGFRGGASQGDPTNSGAIGEGADGYPGSAAKGAGQTVNASPGAGGGYGTNGVDNVNTSYGDAYGSADLTVIQMGGAASANSSNPHSGNGGNSGSIVILICDSIDVSAASVVANGQDGSSGGTQRGNGGGSGSSVLLVCRVATLGSATVTALGGNGSSGTQNGGNGGVGRIAVHHSGTVTGTTNPTFTDVTDNTLVESSGALFFGQP